MDYLLTLLEYNLSPSEIELAKNSFFLLLALPVVTTLVGFIRHIIGLKSISIYAPIILTFAFYQLGYIQADNDYNYLRGLKFGLFLFIVVFLSSSFIYELIRTSRMHYVPKSSLVLTGSAIAIIISIFLSTLLFEKSGLLYIDIFSIIMITTLSDGFISILSRKNFKSTFFTASQTLIAGLIAYTIISIDVVREVMLQYTFIVIALIIILNLLIGKFTGLRVVEYWRFRDILLEKPEENVKSNIKDTK